MKTDKKGRKPKANHFIVAVEVAFESNVFTYVKVVKRPSTCVTRVMQLAREWVENLGLNRGIPRLPESNGRIDWPVWSEAWHRRKLWIEERTRIKLIVASHSPNEVIFLTDEEDEALRCFACPDSVRGMSSNG